MQDNFLFWILYKSRDSVEWDTPGQPQFYHIIQKYDSALSSTALAQMLRLLRDSAGQALHSKRF